MAALSVLESFDEPRAIPLALRALHDGDADVAPAIGVLRGWLTREDGTQALDAVTAAVPCAGRQSGRAESGELAG